MLTLFSRVFQTVNFLKQHPEMTVTFIVFLMSELAFDVTWNDLEKFQAKPYSFRNLIASTIRKSAEVSLRQLEQESRKEFEVAKFDEISDLVAIRSSNGNVEIIVSSWRHHEDALGSAIQRIWQTNSTLGDHWLPRDVRTEALVALRRGRSMFLHGHRSQPVLH